LLEQQARGTQGGGLQITHLSIFLPDASKTDVPEDFDIDLEDPETEKAAVTIQSQFRKFQKKKRDEKS
uniref:Purkinje cell protein 4 n=1 Tax=Amphilophus citrinellus TaxID=61819 RepID=A0A3Q0RT17_AMPCI